MCSEIDACGHVKMREAFIGVYVSAVIMTSNYFVHVYGNRIQVVYKKVR